MTSLEELLLKWHDQSLAEEELLELNAWLAKPESRARLRHEFDFDTNLLEALEAETALAQARQQARAYQTLEVRKSEVFSPWPHRPLPSRAEKVLAALAFAWSSPRSRLAWSVGGALVILGAVWVLSPTKETLARLEGNVRGVTVVRGTRSVSAFAGFALRSGDRVKTPPETMATLVYLKEPTQIKLQSATQLLLENSEEGKRLELIQGTITAKVAPQSKKRPMLLVTPQAEAKVLSTEFILSVSARTTRLEVVEGAVQLVNREDGKSVVINGGFFATAASGVDLVARSVLPAPWNSQDVGAVGLCGYARIDGQQCKIKGAGRNNCKTKDQFHFVYQALEGDGEIRARVVDVELTHRLARAGVMIRESLKTSAPQAFLFLRAGNGLEFEHRPNSESTTDWISADSAPYWVRLVREGEIITGYKSPDGQAWSEIASERIAMGKRIYIGLGVTSWNNSALATSIFENVSVIPASHKEK